MALEGTHIRYALDVMKKYHISDIEKYISGTMYPDSRYITGVDRALTHPEHFIDENLEHGDDFQKGWFVHLLYDAVQYGLILDLIPEVYECGYGGQGSEFWIRLCAVKNIQDMEDIKSFDIVKYLPHLNYVENPNNENISMMQKYNKISQGIYSTPEEVTEKSYTAMWKGLGIGDDVVIRIQQKTREYSKDKKILEAIRSIHDLAMDIEKPLKIISSPKGVCTYRKAVRAVVMDDLEKIALLHVSKNKYHKLPGGGVEKEEDDMSALKRECLEEIGYAIDVDKKIGWIIEYQKKGTVRQYSQCYRAHSVGDKKTPVFTKEEMNAGFIPLGVSPEEAIDLLKNDTPDDEISRSIVERDLAFLLEF